MSKLAVTAVLVCALLLGLVGGLIGTGLAQGTSPMSSTPTATPPPGGGQAGTAGADGKRVAVDGQGKYVVNKTAVPFRSPDSFADLLVPANTFSRSIIR